MAVKPATSSRLAREQRDPPMPRQRHGQLSAARPALLAILPFAVAERAKPAAYARVAWMCSGFDDGWLRGIWSCVALSACVSATELCSNGESKRYHCECQIAASRENGLTGH